MNQNDDVANIEALAVNAVSDLIAKCPQLEAALESNDKTPITDGHVDLYSAEKHSKSSLYGRVPVQVKGRSTNSQKLNPSFSIDRSTLKFFRRNGGGLYFLVHVRKDFESRSVFFVNLNPFRIDRMLELAINRKSFPIQFAEFPSDPTKIQALFALAVEQQRQGKTEGSNERILQRLRSVTIHALDEIHADRPTVFNLLDTDFAVTVETEEGLKLPFDMDLTVLPGNYVPHAIDATIRCGNIEFIRPILQQVDSVTNLIRLSDGLAIHGRVADGNLTTEIDLSLIGGLRDQLRNVDFFLAASRGEPLVINGIAHKPADRSFSPGKPLVQLRNRLANVVELLDSIGADEPLIESISWSDDDKNKLFALYKAFVLNEDVAATSDGYGRLDIDVGPFTITTVVSAGSTPDRLRFTDAFDPLKRSRFKLWQKNDEGLAEEVTNGTVYESLDVLELPRILNLHLDAIVGAYENLDDRSVACAAGNQMVLNLLSAADSLQGPRRVQLLKGAEGLSDWLTEYGEDKLLHQINRWQTRARLGSLSAEDKVDIRKSRRAAQRKDDDEHDFRLREACLSILLADIEELDLVVNQLPEDARTRLRSWPIWTLVATSDHGS